jgi:hypothetical protein
VVCLQVLCERPRCGNELPVESSGDNGNQTAASHNHPGGLGTAAERNRQLIILEFTYLDNCRQSSIPYRRKPTPFVNQPG